MNEELGGNTMGREKVTELKKFREDRPYVLS
jgi:hypothetical protein